MFSSLADSLTSGFQDIVESLQSSFRSSEGRKGQQNGRDQDPEEELEQLIKEKDEIAERARDDAIHAYILFSQECEKLQEEYERMREAVEQLGGEYGDSKGVSYFKRYSMLKGMVKRTVLQFKLWNDEDTCHVTLTRGKHKEEQAKREEHVAALATEEILDENKQIQEQMKEYERKVSMIADLVEIMETKYEESKRYLFFQRYRLLKASIKTVIHNRWI